MMMMMLMLLPSLEACDRMVTGFHLTSYLAPRARATAASVHTVIAYGVLVKQQGKGKRKYKHLNKTLTEIP